MRRGGGFLILDLFFPFLLYVLCPAFSRFALADMLWEHGPQRHEDCSVVYFFFLLFFFLLFPSSRCPPPRQLALHCPVCGMAWRLCSFLCSSPSVYL